MNQTSASTHKRVFSGIQPSGELTIGNYIGAVKHWVELQNHAEYDNLYCVVDLHTLTVKQDPELLRGRIRSLAAMLMAVGLDPKRSTIFLQSHVSAHAEGAWLLNCITPMGWLNKMTQYKDKSKKQETVLAGLFNYPVLMAADILLYDAHLIPIGDDQKQHVELARNIAERFNFLYGATFVVPEPMIPTTGARIMGLDDPTAKMSKSSATNRGHAVSILDDPKEIERSFMRAKTDSGSTIRFSDDPENAGVNNLLGIYCGITGITREAAEAEFANARGYGDLKKRVAEVTITEFGPIKARHSQLMKDPLELDHMLARGAERAREIANPKLRVVMEKMGLVISAM